MTRMGGGVSWYEDHAEVAALLRYLADLGQLGGVDECISVCEKPWHWEVEHDAMVYAQIEDGWRA